MEADSLVQGARNATYGDARDDFRRIGNLWTSYLDGKGYRLDHEITPSDVALMMVLLKMARLMETPSHRDSMVDIAGYTACLAHIEGLE